MESVHEWVAQLPGLNKTRKEYMVNLFSTLLGLRGKANYLNLSRYMDYDERTLRRHSQESFPFEALNTRLSSASLSGRQILAGDATFVPKSGKKTYGLARFWNGCAHRAERGLEVSVLALVDEQRQAMALTADQTPVLPDKESRTAFYLQQVHDSRPFWPEGLRYGVFDGFYAKQTFVDGLCDTGLDMVSKLRHDADLKYLYTGEQKPRGRKRKFDGKVYYDDRERFEYLGELEPGIQAWTQKVWHVSLKRVIRVVLLLNTRKPEKQSHILLFATDVALSGYEIIELYSSRFAIEFLFRDAKQYLGFADCQARNQKALDFHFNVSLSALNLAKAEALQNHPEGQSFTFSMQTQKCLAFNEHLLERFISKFDLDRTLIKSHPAYSELRRYGAIAS